MALRLLRLSLCTAAPSFIAPGAAALRHSLTASDRLSHRRTAFQDVTLRLIAERLLPSAWRGRVYVQGEVSQQHITLPPPRPSPPGGPLSICCIV